MDKQTKNLKYEYKKHYLCRNGITRECDGNGDQLHCLHVNANINGSGDVDCIGNPMIQRYDRR